MRHIAETGDGTFLEALLIQKSEDSTRMDGPTQISSIVAGSSFVFSNVAYMNYDVIEVGVRNQVNDSLAPSTMHALTHPPERP